jgi:type II secretory pathway component GspD/PulD (secretin)
LQLSPTIRDLDDLPPLNVIQSANFNLQANTPVVRTVAVQTTVAIPDRGVMVIGGLSKVDKKKETTGIPILSKIPLLGRLFRHDVNTMKRENILILVNAEIILLEEVESNL